MTSQSPSAPALHEDGETITMSTFGASAPLAKLQEKYGFTLDNVCSAARKLIESLKSSAA